MRLYNLSLRWKTAIPIILFISVGVLITIIFTGYKTKSIVFDEIRHSALDGIRDTVLNSLTTMMFTGNYAESKEQFLEQMSRIADVRVVRARSMDADYPPGKGKAPHYPSGPIEQEVVEKGVARVSIEGDSIHAVYPYLAGSNIMGKNCLTCHKAKEGEAIGAVSIRIPIGESLGRIRALQYLYVAFGIAGVGGMTVLVLGIVGFALRPLKAFLEEMQALGRNYSVAELSEQKGDEVARVAETVKNVTRHLNTMITGIMVSTSKLLPVIDILKDVVEKTTRGAKRQSEEAAQIAASAEEMNQTIGDIAKNASIAADTSTGALKIASGGKERADSAIGEVKDVKRSTVELAGMVEQLNSRVGEIGDIVTVIKDIADQTNLLALNAAIEAARAGEQGRGFAVVADEVRKLAERTIKATAEISEKIHRVQEESEHTAHSMEGAAQKSTAAADRIGSIGEALEAVLAETRKVQDQVARIATAVEEQSSTTGEITRNIESTSSIAADIEKMSGRVLAEVMKLTAAADEIRTTTAGVKTRGGALVMLELAKSDHKGFVERLSSCLKGETTMEAAKLPDHHSCRFGKWYDKEGLQLCGGMSSFTALETPHSRMHQLAKQAVEAHNAGDERKAEQVFREVAEASARIMELLEKAKTECAQADN